MISFNRTLFARKDAGDFGVTVSTNQYNQRMRNSLHPDNVAMVNKDILVLLTVFGGFNAWIETVAADGNKEQ